MPQSAERRALLGRAVVGARWPPALRSDPAAFELVAALVAFDPSVRITAERAARHAFLRVW